MGGKELVAEPATDHAPKRLIEEVTPEVKGKVEFGAVGVWLVFLVVAFTLGTISPSGR